jgi:hypothetical protein
LQREDISTRIQRKSRDADTERMGMLVDRTAGVRVSYKRVKRTTG